MSVRKRFLYTMGGQPLPEPIEISEDTRLAERRAQTPTEELVYGSLGCATDGTDISSRRKHREYMKANNLALQSDFKETGARAAEERRRFYAGESYDTARRREAVGRAFHQLETQSRRKKR